jgi:hypothetical protein
MATRPAIFKWRQSCIRFLSEGNSAGFACGNNFRSKNMEFAVAAVGKLGRTQDENPIARQHLELANSNFAEVGAGPRNLIPNGAKPSFQNRDKEVDQRSTSVFRLRTPIWCRRARCSNSSAARARNIEHSVERRADNRISIG